MASQVDLCNAALVKLGQDIPIAAMSESTKAARAFSRVWSRTLDLVLSEHPWPFTVKAVALALDTEAAFPGWQYRYAYPSDCLTALAVCGESGVRASMSYLAGGGWLSSESRLPLGDGRVEFEVVAGDQQTCIVSDLPAAYLLYGSRVIDTSRFPPIFGEAVACKLAFEVAPALAGELGLKLRNTLQEDYQIARSQAIAHGFNESRESVATTPSLAARGGY